MLGNSDSAVKNSTVKNSTNKKQIILIHGMWMNTLSMRFIGRQLTKQGWKVIYYDYSSMFASFEQNVEGLYALWNKTRMNTGALSTHLVGHSLGGLLILTMIKKYQLTDLPRTLLMGSPVNGSAVAKKMLPSKLGKVMLGKSALALTKGAEGGNVNKIGIIVGKRGIGIGHLIQRLPKPHDGVVAIEEAQLQGAEDKIVLPVTHATMLLSKQVADAIDRYLSKGSFRPPT